MTLPATVDDTETATFCDLQEKENNTPSCTSIPWHSHFFLVGSAAFFIHTFPGVESLDEVSTVETFTKVLFPTILSLEMVTAIRFFFALIIFFDCGYAILWGKWDQDTDYEPQSKLVTITIHFRGIFLQHDRSILRGLLTMSSFTMISWFILGISFLLSGTVSLMHVLGSKGISPWLLRAAILMFECAAPTTMLVSAVVKYFLWPMALEQGSANTTVLSNPVTLLEHNGNVMMALTEITVLGGIPVRWSDMAIAPLFGIVYVYFAFWMADKWAPEDKGPQYCYPFFDPTLGWACTMSLVALLLILTFFYLLFASVDYVMSMLEGGLWTRAIAVGVLVKCVCRWGE